MKILKHIVVDDIDYKTYEPIPNAAIFKEKYIQFSTGVIEYKFYDKKKWEEAEADLVNLGLENSSGFKIELETAEEFKNHPVFIVAIKTEFELVKQQADGTWYLNAKVMKKNSLCKDLNTSEYFAKRTTKVFLEKYFPYLNFENVSSSDNKKEEYYKVNNLPILEYPLIVKKAKGVKQLENGLYDTDEPAGLLSFSKQAIEQINKNKLSICSEFSFNDKIYPDFLKRLIASGEFAFELKKQFEKENNTIQFTPLSLDYI